MNRRSVHISIPNHCHESWDRMDATARGAFCHSCQKEVIDFSAMTDREVIEYLERYKAGCGRFRKDQLNANLTIPTVANGTLKWRALLLSALSLFGAKMAIAQTGLMPNKQSNKNTVAPKAKGPSVKITGNIFDLETNEIIHDANVSFIDRAGNKIGETMTTDTNGYYSLSIDTDTFYSKGLRLKLEHPDYLTETIELSSGVNQYNTVSLSSNSTKKKAQAVVVIPAPTESLGYTGIIDLSQGKYYGSPAKKKRFHRIFSRHSEK